MKKQLALLACVLLSRMLCSQTVPMALEEWRTTDGTQNFYYKSATKTDPSGNIIVAGATMNGGTTDILVAKYNSGGNQLWIKQFAGTATNGVDFAGGLSVDNNYIYLTGAITNNTLVPETDCVTMKLASSTGSVVWSATYNGGGNYHDMGKHVVVDGSGNVYIAGGTYNASMNADYLCIKYNSSGTQQWVSAWDYLGFDDASTKVAISGANLTLTGAVTTATASAYKVSVLSLSQSTGSLLATSVGTAVTTTSVDVVTDFVSDGSGNIIVAGSNNVVGQGNNFYVQKLSNTLAPTWTYTYNGSSSLNDVAKAIDIDASGNVYIAGYTTSSTLGKEFTLIKLNSSGTQQWVQTGGFNGNDEAADLVVDASGDIYVGGYKTDSTQNYYTAKYDGSGTKIWEAEMTGLLSDYATNITLDSLNNVIVTGQSESTLGNFNFTTVKYVQRDVITPTDFSGETPSNSFMYYPNRGQLIGTNDTLVPDIKFYTHDTYPGFYFKSRSQSYLFSKIDTVRSTLDTLQRIDLAFTNSLESAGTYALEAQDAGYLNYYLAHTGEGITGVFGNQRLITPGLYNNIDLMCSSNQDGIKYYFIVKPGGDMRDIKTEFTGATSYSLDGTSNTLSVNSDLGSITFSRPIAYQLTAANATVAVTGWTPDWMTDGASNKYKFNNGSYTSSLTLVIEVKQEPISVTSASASPVWGTFYGGSGSTAMSLDIVTDNSGNLYSAGFSDNLSIPIVTGIAYKGGYSDAFMTSFNPNYGLRYLSYYGGTDSDKGYSITYDAQNDKIYMCGSTNYSASPIMALSGSATCYTNNSWTNLNKGFITRYDALSGAMEWATRWGLGDGYGTKIKADVNGNIYMIGNAGPATFTTNCGASNSGAFPLCDPGGTAYFQNIHLSSPGSGTSTNTFHYDGYIARFNSQTALTWSTLFGGNGDDYMMGLTVDDTNQKLYVTGFTQSTSSGVQNCNFTSNTFPLCNSNGSYYYQDRLNGNGSTPEGDGFISKFDLSTLALEWSTFYGGSAEDAISSVVTDNNNNVFIAGYTKTSTAGSPACGVPGNNGFPFCAASSYTQSFGGGYDVFVSKFSSGGILAWSSYFGGPSNDIVVEKNSDPKIAWNNVTGDVVVSGNTRNTTFFPNASSGTMYQQGGHGDAPCSTCPTDAFVASFSNSGSLLHSTRFGGKGSVSAAFGPKGDIACGLALYQNRVYISGGSYSTNSFPFACPPTTNPYCNTAYGATGNSRAFYAQLEAAVVGIHELDKKPVLNSLHIYPNPTNNQLNVEWEGTESKTVELAIYNLMGQVITSSTLKEYNGLNKQAINVSDLKFGLYLVVIKTQTQTLNAKFIKE